MCTNIVVCHYYVTKTQTIVIFFTPQDRETTKNERSHLYYSRCKIKKTFLSKLIDDDISLKQFFQKVRIKKVNEKHPASACQ